MPSDGRLDVLAAELRQASCLNFSCWHPHRLQVLLAVLLCGCSPSPELPDVPAEVVALAPRYDEITATLDSDAAYAIIEATLALRDRLSVVSGLRFVGGAFEDATQATAESQDLSVDVRGTIAARTACPGPDGTSTDEALTGFFRFGIGIERTRLQRAFNGHMERCSFPVGTRTHATATADLQVDLGARLGLSEPFLGDLLIRATDVQVLTFGEFEQPFQLELLHFRLTTEAVVQTLIELDLLDIGLTGTALLELDDFGMIGLRGNNGAWRCGTGRGDPCVPAG